MITRGKLKSKAGSFAQANHARHQNVFGDWARLPDDFGAPKRQRLFDPETTFWLFLGQVLGREVSCREVVRTFLAGLLAQQGRSASPNTAAYCKARARLNFLELRQTSQRIVDQVSEQTADWKWLGRRVMVADGSGLSMPDTAANQRAWPQSQRLLSGCSFPVMRIVALFSLSAGVMIDLAHGAFEVSEQALLRTLWPWLLPMDVLLVDRGFGGYAELMVLARRGVDCVVRKNARRKNAGVIRRIGPNDRIVLYRKSGPCPNWLAPKTWSSMPDRMAIREVTVHVDNPGFRTSIISVVTTLLDDKAYPAAAIAELYRRRWTVEVYLRDIKTSMGMDVLSCKSPAMVELELWTYVIAYNLVRAVMADAALTHEAKVGEISFMGTVSTLRQWAPMMARPGLPLEQRIAMYDLMLYYIIKDRLRPRPGRMEPRAKKRRPKNYQLLNKPRGEFREIRHRNKYKKVLS